MTLQGTLGKNSKHVEKFDVPVASDSSTVLFVSYLRMVISLAIVEIQGRRETGRAPGLGLSWGPTVEGCKNLFWVTPLAMQLDGL